MDIAALSIGMANMKTSTSFGVGVMKKALDQVEQTGDQLVDMIDSISDSTIDITV